jgi:tRNA A-37 threonylcarbamoyl transferase component Bud32
MIHGNDVMFSTVIKGGCTSEVYKCSKNQFVKKRVTRFLDHNCYEREIHVLKLLSDHNFEWCPKLIETNDNEKSFVMNYCGERMSKLNKPKNYKEQIQHILNDMKSINLKHNDIKKGEILVLKSKIYIVDFGWASINDNFSCGLDGISSKIKPCGIYDDNRMINL